MEANIIALATIFGALILGAISPGPSFILVARTAMASARRAGMGAAVGMAAGSFIISLVALLGLHTLLSAVPWLWLALKTAGGLYLLWMAFRMFRGAKQPLLMTQGNATGQSFQRAFLTAFGTQVSNPKTAVVFAGIFAALLPPHISKVMYVSLPVISMLVDGLWYAFVAYALSSSGPRNTYLRYKAMFDRLGGSVMALLGIRLIVK
ncbi:LysE family translocator [Erwinia mallotivora]|uniref:Threonine transporter n=1 Tax=Erwinia mallotivora TaxID=69222 RepID=A0A014NNU0_9GAMM|nr:LysE family transporter [Erwinia mallotivora]EXU75500.1 threonine transporter [Erwinia mallotivora]